VRPRLRLPDAVELFTTLFRQAGYSVYLSDKGRYQQRSADLWGGFDLLAQDLGHAGIRRLLDGWRETSKDGTEPGLMAGTRRFLTWEDCQTLLGDEADMPLGVLIGRYLDNRILRRGYVLRCATCSDLSWYPLEDVASSFTCRRCWSTATPTYERTPGGQPDLTISYDLNEVVFQLLHHNGRVPIAALDRLRDGSTSFLAAPEMSLTPAEGAGSSGPEVDVLAICDGRIHVGEVKVASQLSKSPKEERRIISRILAAATAVTADVVVFGTAAPRWAPSTRTRIETALDQEQFELAILEGL